MLTKKQLIVACCIACCINVLMLLLFVVHNGGKKCFLTIDEKQGFHTVIPDDFLSIGIDASEIQNYDTIDFTNTRLMELAAALSPARLRLGGTMSDRLIFSAEDIPSASCDHCPSTNATESTCTAVQTLCKQKFLPFFILSGKKWTEINEFCADTNIKLLFSLNVLIRDEHEWKSDNAVDIIEYSKQKEFDLDWQLGNEPNSFGHVFNLTISPETLAHDYKKLRELLNDHGYNNSMLVGPDTTRPQKAQPKCLEYMIDFLGNGSRYINARAWHQYYLNSRTATLEDFWNPKTFDLLKEQIEMMTNHTKKFNSIPMWLSETSSSYGGGAPGLSNSYAGTPLWLDKLGLSAKYNITTVIRQSFFGGNYSLIDANLQPLPDWWVSVLYKRLVGNKVVSISCNCSSYQRIYAHCANRKYTNDTSAITIYGVNLQMEKPSFYLKGQAFGTKNLQIDEYIISAPSNNRKSTTVLLNGWPLHYESSLPDMKPKRIKNLKRVYMSPYSIGFWVVKNTSIEICK